jgi:hypothetical protein
MMQGPACKSLFAIIYLVQTCTDYPQEYTEI